MRQPLRLYLACLWSICEVLRCSDRAQITHHGVMAADLFGFVEHLVIGQVVGIALAFEFGIDVAVEVAHLKVLGMY